MASSDPFDLKRFVEAQGATYAAALGEIRKGRKTTHWIWFVFPQVRGIGFSEMSRRYAIQSLAEAKAYLAHPVLGHRYRECVAALQDLPATSAQQVFGEVDAAKLRSSLTLFLSAAPDDRLLVAALDRWYHGITDPKTAAALASA